MEGNTKKIVWTIGAQMIALAIGLLMVALIVWVASKSWKKGQSNYAGVYGSIGNESGYDSRGGNWLGY